MSQNYDLRGNTILADSITTTSPSTSSEETITTLNTVNLNLGTGAKINLDSGTATLSSNAATITKWASVVTTESLTTAHTATATFVITLSGVAEGDLAFVQIAGGSNTGGIVGGPKAVTSTNTITITIKNEALTTNAFNGTLIFNLLVLKA